MGASEEWDSATPAPLHEEWDSAKPAGPASDFGTFQVPSRPRTFVSPEDTPARMVTNQRGMRDVSLKSPNERAIHEIGGIATDVASKAGLPPEYAAGVGATANVAAQLPGIFMGGEVGKTGEGIAKGLGVATMKKALKASPSISKTDIPERAATAMLNEGISVSKGGRETAQMHIDALKNTVDDLASRAQGEASILDILKPAQEKIRELKSAKGGLDFEEKISMVRQEIAKLLDNPDFRGKARVPIPVANEMKRAIQNKEVGDAAYKTGFKSGSEKEAKEIIARGLREQVEKFVPEAKGLNRSMGDMIEARKLIDARLGRQASSTPVSPFTLLMAMKHPGYAAIHAMENNPQITSALARALYSGEIPTNAGRLAGAGLGAYSGSAPNDR